MPHNLQRVIALIESGDKDTARQYLIEILNVDPKNDQAWLCMSAVVDTDNRRRECLEKALESNPDNHWAKKELSKLDQKSRKPPRRTRQKSSIREPIDVFAVQADVNLSFKFRCVRQGVARGILAQKGHVTNDGLILGQDALGYDDIVETTVRDDRLILVISPRVPLGKYLSKNLLQGNGLIVHPHGVKVLDLEKRIDRLCSRREAKQNKERLVRAGKGHLFRASICPGCQAIVDVSELAETPYVYCRFCDSVFTKAQRMVTKGLDHGICDECQMFDRVQDYTEFYFYFLLVVYGFSIRNRHLCDTCANRLFLRMLLLNSIFIVGLLPTFYLKIRSLTGRHPDFKNLAEANALTRKGRGHDAAPIYDRIRQKYPEHPGLLMNEGLGHLIGDNASEAQAYFERSLKACANYFPVLRIIRKFGR